MATQPDLFQADTMGRGEISYRIYPSLLDKYQQLLDYEEEADAPWNKWSASSIERARAEHERQNSVNLMPTLWVEPRPGDYILTPDEMYDKIEEELIMTINREGTAISEAADKGTSLNEVIDCLVMGKPCGRSDMTIQSIRVDNAPISIRADFDGFTFDFDINLCLQLKEMLKGSVCQSMISAPIKTKYGDVLLYGYMDYWLRDRIIDLKTTSQYNWGKYERKWQRHVYPYCAIESGLTDTVSEFTYLCAQLGKGKTITGHIFPETYSYRHDQSTALITAHLESFIRWLEEHRERITDKKIFNDLEIE